ncbi:cadherin-like domain-containing protein, partial [bacterium]|nr:cadherin-like domain-containing protein [bacterium]
MSLTDEWLNKGKQLREGSMVLKFISITLLASVCVLFFLPQVVWPQEQCESHPVFAGYRGFEFDGGGVTSEPTEEKPESKLWHTGGFWWGILWDPAIQAFSIHRFNRDSQCWTDVGPAVDGRGRTSQDVFWDESSQKLYVASHGKSTIQASQPQEARLYRFSYHSSSGTFSLDSGFPVNINDEKSRALVITKDSNGKLWATWTSGLRVIVNSATNDGANWGVPFELPGQGNNLKQDDTGNTLDISSIISFGGDKIGVFWGNQIDKKYYFMVHNDSDPDAIWQPKEIALQGFFGNSADDHINLSCPSNHSTVLAAVKSDINGSTNPLIRVLKRHSDTGVWTAHIFGFRSEEHTRPIILVDSDSDSVYVFAKSAVVDPSAIYYKVAHIDNLSFPSGLGRVFMQSDVEDNINNPTSTKQSVNASTGLLVLASNKQHKRYMHNFLALGGNHGPALIDDVASTPQNTPALIDVMANDTDQDDSVDATTVHLVDSTSNGSLSIDAVTGIVTYTPTAGFLGTDSFRYSARDQDDESNLAATVTITVHVNNLPVAAADEASTNEEIAVPIDVLANDSDSDGTIVPSSVQISSPPANGATQVNDTTGVITYLPNVDFVGNDAFSYTVRDNSDGTSNPGTVTVTVSDINDPPVALDDIETTSEEAVIVIDVTTNDSDIDGTVDVTTVSLASLPGNGQATISSATGEISYTPNTDFVGGDSFTYTVNDEDGATSNPATVMVNVISVNDPPIAAADTAITDEDLSVVVAILSNDSDVDGTIVPSSIALVTQPNNGAVTVNTVNGLITYDPNPGFHGTDSFLYSVSDNEEAASQGTVTIIVNDINDAPLAVDDGASTSEDIEVVIEILNNDTDSDGTLIPRTITILANVSNGTTT